MALQRWNKKGLIWMGEQGYKVVPCKNEQEVSEIKNILKANKRCAQTGWIMNKENKVIYFVLTKQRNKRQ